jgi:pimeloyl-ACP methyl ester carboxylesterase
MDRSPRLGFRCVKYLRQPSAEKSRAPPTRSRDFGSETAATPKQIDQYLTHYAYFRDEPLHERRSVEQTDEYVHETIRIASAYREEFDIHLFLPHRGRPPYEPIVMVPDLGAFEAERFVVPPGPTSKYFLGLLDERRALCWPVFKGMFGRSQPPGEPSLSRERDLIILVAKDLSRTVDYLQTLPDMNMDKLAYYGGSWGAAYGPTLLVVEPRFKAAVLVSGGYRSERKLPEVEPAQFAPYVTVPVLMVNGRYDPRCPVETLQRPFYRDLGSRDKLHVLFDSRHAPPVDQTLEVVSEWLRERFR